MRVRAGAGFDFWVEFDCPEDAGWWLNHLGDHDVSAWWGEEGSSIVCWSLSPTPPQTIDLMVELVNHLNEVSCEALLCRIWDALDREYPVQPCGAEEDGDCRFCGAWIASGKKHNPECPWPELDRRMRALPENRLRELLEARP